MTSAIAARWVELAPMLERAVMRGHGYVSLDEVRQCLENGDMQAWAIIEQAESYGVIYKQEGKLLAVCATEVKSYTSKKAVCFNALGGSKMNEWLDLLIEMVRNFAREVGATELVAVGRRGWVRQLSSRGFDEKMVTVVKEI
ncbi:MAG: hypothetical protein ACRCWJ_16400 [Casimicrobium sp.]